ncbi:MAG TPA: YbaL family putative K(+) efflux transporter [Dongiaceae bacterium]|jgi:CPA2 family monovalent cation:H+ antiporter-2|nr:YbaL family putative K(+) efflux transporter [Dongiaceae bacterium]
MEHHTPLIAAIVSAIVLAFVLGALAQRLRISPLVGYLLAGVVVGPFTPGFVADQSLIAELAEIGVILLMFGVGLHFSLKDLLSVKSIAVPGAIGQIAVATLLGWGLAHLLGWSNAAGLVFGLALSVASTVVLLRALQERRLVETTEGRIAVGWLVVEDLFMVLALVLLPPLAEIYLSLDRAGTAVDAGSIAWSVALTLGKVAAFVAVMLVFGRRAVPWILHAIAHTGSRELFRLAVLSIALGIAFGAAALFGVSFALGAFFAGMILSESELSHQAAEETLPLRDAFAVLFFVSVGMLVDPTLLVTRIWPLLGALAIVLLGKSVAAFLIVRTFGHPSRIALVISASLAQIGEFSFILGGLGVTLGIMDQAAHDLILATAIVSILVNPAFFVVQDRWRARLAEPAAPAAARASIPVTPLRGHHILIGHGRVGSIIAERLRAIGAPYLVIDARPAAIEALKASGIEAIAGNAADPAVLAAANPAAACCLLVAVPDAFEAGSLVEEARRANPGLPIIARAHSDAEEQHLQRLGATSTVLGERELALEMLRKAGL